MDAIISYSKDLFFTCQEDAREARDVYDGCDPNLLELVQTFPMVVPVVERLAFGDEYKGILEKFKGSAKPVNLLDNEYDIISGVIEERRADFQRVLKM